METKPLLVAGLLGALLLAGCAQSNDGTSSDTSTPDSFKDIQTAPDTGVIKGIVVSESITPIAGANVQLTGQKLNKTTDKDGAFVFTDLKAGTYFLKVSKLGFFTQQTSTTVVEGETDVKTLKVILPVDRTSTPFAQLYKWDGFLECGFGVGVAGGVGVNPCAVDSANSHNTQEVEVIQPISFIQIEMVWEGTQQLGSILNVGIYASGTANFVDKSGESPLTLPVTKEIFDKNKPNVTSMIQRVFTGTTDSSAFVTTLNQRFTVYTTEFHGFLPREDWTFVKNGDCRSPAECGKK